MNQTDSIKIFRNDDAKCLFLYEHSNQRGDVEAHCHDIPRLNELNDEVSSFKFEIFGP